MVRRQATPERAGPVTDSPHRVVGDLPRPGRRRRGALIAALVVGALLLAGCQTTAWVRVEVNPDGSGTVAVDVFLDREAAARVGDLSELLVVDDLEQAGWTVVGPARPSEIDAERLPGAGTPSAGPLDELVQIHLERPFADVDEANAILASLSGPDGPLRDVALSRQSSLFRTELRFTGTVDLSRGLDTFGDADLTEVLGGSLTDTFAASGEQELTGDALRVGLQIVPSGDLAWSGEMGNESMGNETVSALAGLGDPAESVDVSATRTRWGAVVTAAVLIGAVMLGLVVVGFRLRRGANRAERALLGDIEVSDPFAEADDDRGHPDDAGPRSGDGGRRSDSGADDGAAGGEPPVTS